MDDKQKAEVVDMADKQKADVTSPPTVLEGFRGESSEETTPEGDVKEQRGSTLLGTGVKDLSLRFDTAAEGNQLLREWEAVASSIAQRRKLTEPATMPELGECSGLQEAERPPRQQSFSKLDGEALSKWAEVAKNLASRARVVEPVVMPQLGCCSGWVEKEQKGGKLKMVGNDNVIRGAPPYSATLLCVGVPVDPKENYAGFSGCYVRVTNPVTRRQSAVVVTAAHCLERQQRVYVFPECPNAADLPSLPPSRIWVTKNPTDAYMDPEYKKPPLRASDKIKVQAAARDIAAFRIQPLERSKKATQVGTLVFGLSDQLQAEDPDVVLTVGYGSEFLKEEKRVSVDDIPTAHRVVLWQDEGQLVPITANDRAGELSKGDMRGVIIKAGEAWAGMSGGPWVGENDFARLGGVQSCVSQSRHWIVSPRLDIAVMDKIGQKLA